jgi:hypothetical protein
MQPIQKKEMSIVRIPSTTQVPHMAKLMRKRARATGDMQPGIRILSSIHARVAGMIMAQLRLDPVCANDSIGLFNRRRCIHSSISGNRALARPVLRSMMRGVEQPRRRQRQPGAVEHPDVSDAFDNLIPPAAPGSA